MSLTYPRSGETVIDHRADPLSDHLLVDAGKGRPANGRKDPRVEEGPIAVESFTLDPCFSLEPAVRVLAEGQPSSTPVDPFASMVTVELIVEPARRLSLPIEGFAVPAHVWALIARPIAPVRATVD